MLNLKFNKEGVVKNKDSGITLISLVVTIIVLLILAGISISMLSGDNGLLKRAENAKINTKTSSTKEQILLEILGSYDKSVSLNLNTLKSNLESIGASVNGNEFPITVSLNNQIYTIDENGKMEDYIPVEPLTDEQIANAIGGFVNYNVSYIDVYKDYNYSATNGWRILNIEENDSGKYDIDIISTGIPAELNCSGQDPTNSANASYSWWGDLSDIARTAKVNKYYGTSFDSYDGLKRGYWVAYGLINNFNQITFEYKSDMIASSNKGVYKKINGNGSGTIFSPNSNLDILDAFTDSSLSAKITSIRNVEYRDIKGYTDANKAPSSMVISDGTGNNRKGLFVLQNIKNITTLSTYTYDSGRYWIGTPDINNAYSIKYISYNGNPGSHASNTYGVRPVISFSGVTISITDDGYYKLK